MSFSAAPRDFDGDSRWEEERFGVARSRASITMAFGQGVLLTTKGASYAFQNFNVGGPTRINMGSKSRNFNFLPFTYTGVSLSRSGDNVSTELAVPNTELTRPWALNAIEGGWLGKVFNLEVDCNDASNNRVMYTYVGQVTAGGWDQAAVILKLNSVLDAVEAEVPWQTLNRNNVGRLPVSSNVRL